MYTLGYDIGTSAIKAALVDTETGATLAQVRAPEGETPVSSPHPAWAEQEPESWWKYLIEATQQLFQQHPEAAEKIGGIGIAYQMHGLVLVDAQGKVLRPSIIWSDSRATDIGRDLAEKLGEAYVFSHLLNAPGNFTASKLSWVAQHEPEVFEKARYMMLPGDYIAYRLSGEATTTASGLSEGTLWDFPAHAPAYTLMETAGLSRDLLPPLVPNIGKGGSLSEEAANLLGLKAGIPLTYRAGDQPNNAVALGGMNPGEVVGTAGTSGVVYALTDQLVGDTAQRVNSFAHVNHEQDAPRIGVLLCINATGSLYAWLRRTLNQEQVAYNELEAIAQSVPLGAEGLRVIPFGNGAERMLHQQPSAAHLLNMQFHTHTAAHIYRAGLEAIACSFAYGVKAMKDMGVNLSSLKVGNDNLFQSDIFAQTVATLVETAIEVLDTSGAVGAARGAAAGILGTEIFSFFESRTPCVKRIEPALDAEPYQQLYKDWESTLKRFL